MQNPNLHSPPRAYSSEGDLLRLPMKQRLGLAVSRAWERPFYRSHWENPSLDEVLDQIHSGNFSSLPIIRKSHLRSHFDEILNFDCACDIVSSSGTTGRPVDIPVHFQQEPGRVLRVRRLLRELGVRPGSKVLQLLSLNDMFTLGVLAWQAIKEEGATAIRCSPLRLDRVLDEIRYNKPEFVIGNPFVLAKIAQEAGDKWPDPSELPNRAFLAVAATFDKNLNMAPITKTVVDLWGFEDTLNQYGTSELGPVAYEERGHQGLRIHDDFHYVELVDPITGKPTAEGEPGEIVVTGLTYPRGFLPVRYGTGDVAAWLKCDAAKNGEKWNLGPIIGRTDHQLKIYGQTVFPDLLLSLADSVCEVQKAIVTTQKDPIKGDDVKILCVAKPGADNESVCSKISRLCQQNLAVSPEVSIVGIDVLLTLEREMLGKTNGSKVTRFFRL